MKKTSQAGFSIVEALLILVIVGILGFTGWYVYHVKQTSDKDYSAATKSTVPTYKSETSAEAKTGVSSVPKGTYLDLKEVGVKFLLNSSVSDAIYAPYIESLSDGGTAYGLSTQTLVNAGGDNSFCTAPNGPLGIIAVSATAPVVPFSSDSSKLMTPDNETLFKIGGKYYHYTPSQDTAGCGGSITAVQEHAYMQAIEQSFTSLQSDATD